MIVNMWLCCFPMPVCDNIIMFWDGSRARSVYIQDTAHSMHARMHTFTWHALGFLRALFGVALCHVSWSQRYWVLRMHALHPAFAVHAMQAATICMSVTIQMRGSMSLNMSGGIQTANLCFRTHPSSTKARADESMPHHCFVTSCSAVSTIS